MRLATLQVGLGGQDLTARLQADLAAEGSAHARFLDGPGAGEPAGGAGLFGDAAVVQRLKERCLCIRPLAEPSHPDKGAAFELPDGTHVALADRSAHAEATFFPLVPPGSPKGSLFLDSGEPSAPDPSRGLAALVARSIAMCVPPRVGVVAHSVAHVSYTILSPSFFFSRAHTCALSSL